MIEKKKQGIQRAHNSTRFFHQKLYIPNHFQENRHKSPLCELLDALQRLEPRVPVFLPRLFNCNGIKKFRIGGKSSNRIYFQIPDGFL